MKRPHSSRSVSEAAQTSLRRFVERYGPAVAGIAYTVLFRLADFNTTLHELTAFAESRRQQLA